MKPLKVTDHPLGGKLRWYQHVGRTFSVLGDGYPHAEDFELQERERIASDDDDVEQAPVIPNTELRFATLTDATDWIEALKEG